MKKTALLAAAAALMAASPAAANGYLGLEYGSGNVDFGADTDFDVLQGEGAFGWGGDEGFGGQFGAQVGTLDFDGGGDVDTYSLDGHLWWNFGSFRIGGVVGVANLEQGGTEIEETVWGAEGAFETANLIFTGSVTAGETDGFGADIDTFNTDVGVRFYATPNIRIGGFVGVGNLDGGGGDVDTTSFGVSGEFQPWSAPLSLTVGWSTFEVDDIGVNSDVFSIGARWNFGGGTLRERDDVTPYTTATGYGSRLYGTW